MIDRGTGGWPAYQRFVLAELERLNKTLEDIRGELRSIHTEVQLLKLKASVWGVASGAIAGTMVTLGAVLLRGSGP